MSRFAALLIVFLLCTKGHASFVKPSQSNKVRWICTLTHAPLPIHSKHSIHKTGYLLTKRKRKSKGLEQEAPAIQGSEFCFLFRFHTGSFFIYTSPQVNLNLIELADRGPPNQRVTIYTNTL